MITHSSIFAWEIPWTEKPGRLQSRGWKELDMTEHTHNKDLLYSRGNSMQYSVMAYNGKRV